MNADRFLDGLTRFVLGPKRLDHEPLYSCTHAGIIASTAVGALSGSTVDPVLLTLDTTAQRALLMCLFVGAGVCLYGIAMGTPFDLWRQANRIARKLLGKQQLPVIDLRRCYRVGICGTPAVIAGLIAYADIIATHAHDWASAAGVFLICFNALGMGFQLLRFLMEIRRINKTLPILVKFEVEHRKLEKNIRQHINARWRR